MNIPDLEQITGTIGLISSFVIAIYLLILKIKDFFLKERK